MTFYRHIEGHILDKHGVDRLHESKYQVITKSDEALLIDEFWSKGSQIRKEKVNELVNKKKDEVGFEGELDFPLTQTIINKMYNCNSFKDMWFLTIELHRSIMLAQYQQWLDSQE